MPPVISKTERRIMYVFVIFCDIFLAITTPFVGINNVVDVFVGLFLIGYGFKRKLLSPKKIAVFALYFLGEQIPGLDIAPFWTLDLKNLYSGTLSEEPEVPSAINGPVNKNGVRRPNNNTISPLNSGGMRPPRSLPPKAK